MPDQPEKPKPIPAPAVREMIVYDELASVDEETINRLVERLKELKPDNARLIIIAFPEHRK